MPPKAIVSSFGDSLDQIARLVRYFQTNRHIYLAGDYKEAQIRQNLIDPLFIALGWDVHNDEKVAPQYSPVVVEPSQEIEGQKKAPDYAFRIGPLTRFYAEAKKISVSIKSDIAPAYQLRRYAWSAKLPLSLLTDFEELSVYDCRYRPSDTDKASVARIAYYGYEEYPDRWREIWDIFSYDAVLHGSFDQYVQADKGKRGTSEVDDEFLKEIEQWRNDLARNIALRNAGIGIDALNDAVQRTIDRIVFLRMAEDRGVEQYGQLQQLVQEDGIYPRLIDVFRKADAKYNSGLFDFFAKEASQTSKLTIDDKVFKSILNRLYYPQSPYEFSVLPIEILGNVYEQFLGRVIRLTPGHQAKIEEKPEVKKAGGVKYTPTHIVDSIVANTVGKLVAGKTPRQLAASLRILDMACGSGSFLLGAYKFLLDYYLQWYIEHNPGQHTKAVWRQGDMWRLTIAERKRILITHLFGVDIDRQAVEVTKLSLLLKVLEGESDETLGQLSLLQERALPNLDANIKCGNSLIGTDTFTSRLVLDPDEMRRANPFDWEREFPEVMKSGGFSGIIGNPPYIRIQVMKEWAPLEVEIYKERYSAAGSGNYDIYVVFVEKALSLLNKQGRMGFILPHKFFNAKYGEPLHALISGGKYLSQVIHFGDQQVFAGVSTYTCLMFLDKAGCDECQFVKVDDLDQWRSNGIAQTNAIPAARITLAEWNFSGGENTLLFEKLNQLPVKLGDVSHIFVGTQTSADDVFVLDDCTLQGKYVIGKSKALDKEVKVESNSVVPFLRGKDIRRYEPPLSSTYLICPYDIAESSFSLVKAHEMAQRYPLTFEYLQSCKVQLGLREKGRFKGENWYAFGYPKSMTLFQRPKIIVPDYNNTASFTYDTEGWYFKTGYGVLYSGSSLSVFYILGLLNSNLLFKYLLSIGTTLRGGYVRFWTQFIEHLPIRTIDFNDPTDKARHNRMVTMVEQMLQLHKRRQSAETDHECEMVQRQIDATDRQIDALVYELYGLTDEEIEIVEGTVGKSQAETGVSVLNK